MIILRQMRDRDLAGNHALQPLPNRPYNAVRKLESLFRFTGRRREWTAGVSEECRIGIQRLSSGQKTSKAELDGLALGLELNKIVSVGKWNRMRREERLHCLLRGLLCMVRAYLWEGNSRIQFVLGCLEVALCSSKPFLGLVQRAGARR